MAIMQRLKHEKNRPMLHGLGVLLLFSGLYCLFFFPELISYKFLAPSDGLLQSLPPFFSPRRLWTPLLWGGFPLAADVTPQTWYPISLLFAAFKSWNGFVISAYVLASSFTYGYVYRLTRSSFAACVSGIIYGMSGFMMAHLGHTSMIHSAAWIPLIIWSLEELIQGLKYRWLVAGSIAVSCCFLGGHPQIFVYGVGLSLFFVLVRGYSLKRSFVPYLFRFLAILIIGILLSGIQLFPLLELSALTPRASLSFEEFLQYSLPINHLLLLIFPYLLGSHGGSPSIYGDQYFGQWNLTELTSYVGLVPLILAIWGAWNISARRSLNLNITRLCWGGAALFSLLLMLGDATPLATLAYHIPGLNKFRALARYSSILALAVSILAGLAVADFEQQKNNDDNKLKRFWIFFGLFSLLASMAAFALQHQRSAQYFGDGSSLDWIFSVRTLGIPLMLGIFGFLNLQYFVKHPRAKGAMALLAILVVLDLSSFGWFYNLAHYPLKELIVAPRFISRYEHKLAKQHQRSILPKGSNAQAGQVQPNTSMLWSLPSLSGYGPLLLERVSKLFAMPAHGVLPSTWHSDLANQSLDIAAVKYAFIAAQSSTFERNGLYWNQENLDLSLGATCNSSTVQSLEFETEALPSNQLLSRPFSRGKAATDIAIVSALACSNELQQADALLEVSVVGEDGLVSKQTLRAGEDTAEWAYDCPDVTPHLQHERADIFETVQTVRPGLEETCPSHRYVTRLALPRPIDEVRSVSLNWQGKTGVILLYKISIFDQVTGSSLPLRQRLRNNERWHFVETVDGTSIYENQRAMPRAWLTPYVEVATAEESLHAIQTSSLRGSRHFNPHQVALIEAPLSGRWADELMQNQEFPSALQLPQPHFEEISATHLLVETQADRSSFLVLADNDYPGWRATLDGKPVEIVRTNYAFRGLPVPSGNHRVEFEFRPRSFHLGLGMTSSAAVLLIGLSIYNRARW